MKEFKLRHASVFVFFVTFAFRLIPEVLAGPWPLGFDTITSYVPIILGWSGGDFNPAHFCNQAPLCYVLLFFIYLVSGSIFLALKVLGPLLYGFLCSSFVFFVAKGLGWNNKKGVLVALLFSSYVPTLRISWDLYRNTLGLAFFFLFLSFLPKFNELPHSRKIFASALAILVALSHEIVSAIMFFVVFSSFALDIFKRKGSSKFFKSSLWFMPALLIFLFIIYSSAITFHEVPGGVSYFTSKSRGIAYDSYFVLAGDIFSLFFLIFGLLLPFIIVGFWRDKKLDSWLLICLLGAFWPIFFPWFQIAPWNRWMYMLAPPFLVYIVNGLDKLQLLKIKRANNVHFRRNALGLSLFLTVFVGVGIGYMVLPISTVPPQSTSIERLSFYIPGGMLSNTFPVSYCEDLEKSLQYVNDRLNNDSVLIIHESLTGWVDLYLDEGKNIINYHFQPHADGLQEALSAGYKRVYLIWWVSDGWYGQKSVPQEFESLPIGLHITVYFYDRE